MTELVKIDLKGLSAYGEDVSQLGANKATNVFLDNNSYLRCRGGLKRIVTGGDSLPNQKIDGIFYWTSKDLIMIVCGGGLYKMDANNFITFIGSGLSINERASFAIVRTNQGVESLAVANLSDIFLYDPQNVTWSNIYVIDADTPRNIRTIVFLDGFLVALPINSNQFYFSEIGSPTDWSALNFASAEGSSDIIETMIVKGQYLYLFGTDTIEIWYQDGSTPFIRLAGAVVENGTPAPYSVAKAEEFLFFLDNKRRLCVTEGQASYRVVSPNIDRYFQSLNSIEDAYAYTIIHQGRVFYVITFPSAYRLDWDASAQTGITFVYDIVNQQFFEWSKWNGSEFGPFPISDECYCSLQRRQIVGNVTGGLLFELDQTTYQDDGYNLVCEYITPFLDFGIQQKKRIKKLRMRMTSGTAITATQIVINYRTDGNAEWDANREVSLTTGASSLNQIHAVLNNLRIGRSYQFKFTSANDTPFCLGQIEAFLDVLTS